VVQGVGFRPFIFGLAAKYGLSGWVQNTSSDVQIEISGDPVALMDFEHDIKRHAPPLAHIEKVEGEEISPVEYAQFTIRESATQDGRYQLISPDLATCQACYREIFDSSDRRYRYPFTNCTNCGPRFTIISDIPYDRANTTMNTFRMCPACQAEYDDPANRRFHAQPNACPACGPTLTLLANDGKNIASVDVIRDSAALLRKGKILAIKGLGGFQLACDATNLAAVTRLRQRKHRPEKPFAVMVANIAEAGRYCLLSPDECRLLSSASAPIVLAERRMDLEICQAVAPRLQHLGIMLPYTPLHHILLHDVGVPLVMTSGNLSEEPIASDNQEAMIRLAAIADAFLVHNRDIRSRYDDSVCALYGGEVRPIRRARGYAPFPVRLPYRSPSLLACGAELKNTFCLTRDEYAFVSQHIGDLENLETLEHFQETLALYQHLFRIQPQAVAFDLHPDYLATHFAQSLSLPKIGVQHHHAHIAACLAENGISEPAIGIALDGTGYGPDGTIWGGEFLLVDLHKYQRLGRLRLLPLPGGDAAIRRPYRVAYAYLKTLLGESSLDLPFLSAASVQERTLLSNQIESGLNTPFTSSCGRLFDAVSASLGIQTLAGYEGQAAVEMEAAAIDMDGTLPFDINESKELLEVELEPLFRTLVQQLRLARPVAELAGLFHNTVAEFCVEMCLRIRKCTGVSVVALSGGVFQNRRLFERLNRGLQSKQFIIVNHRQVPCNDGGISLGQAMVAATFLKKT
jgi:hydrogenase maturation protein HypF